MLKLGQVIGHRGAAAYAPENTLQSFQIARAMGLGWVEFDVKLSADGELFIFHDDTLSRTTKTKGKFSNTHSEVLQTLDCGRWYNHAFNGFTIPRLSEILPWLNASSMQANIEIKPSHGTSKEISIALLAQINRYWHQETLPLVSSFDWEALRVCHVINPDLPLGLLMGDWDNQWLEVARELNCFSIHVNQRNINRERIEQIKKQGYKVCVYTINQRQTAKKMLASGVDAIFSDYPDILTLPFQYRWFKSLRIKKALNVLEALT